MLREHDRNKGSNTRRRPLLGITILDGLGMTMITVPEAFSSTLTATLPEHFTRDGSGENSSTVAKWIG